MLRDSGKLPAFIHMENVPRILSRGKNLLNRIKKVLVKYGYKVDMRANRNLGEVGGLGQNRLEVDVEFSVTLIGYVVITILILKAMMI